MLTAFGNSEEFSPSLLDRLRDDHPRERTESASALACNGHDYRRAILRDIQWLLNTTSLGIFRDGSSWPDAARSTLNFGVPEVCGTAAAALPQRRWEQSIELALAQFEPRLNAETIRVRLCPAQAGQTANQLVIEIAAELIVAPIPLCYRVRIDRETSAAEVQDLTAGAA